MEATSSKSDAQIQDDVLQELRWDTHVRAAHIGVSVSDGVVTLSGVAESWGERHAAQEAAHRVEGVLDVANEIEVKLPMSMERSDADIARSVREALERDVFVPDERIQTTVSGGVVTLEGDVVTWSQHDDAGRAVRNIAGVREVRNLIRVAPQSVPPHEVRAAIEGALARHAAHAAKGVKVHITDDAVSLTGEVPSRAEHRAVLGAVKGTPGVGRVDDRLHVRP